MQNAQQQDEVIRLSEMALRAHLNALAPEDWICIDPPDLVSGKLDPEAKRLEAFALKYNIPMIRFHWPEPLP